MSRAEPENLRREPMAFRVLGFLFAGGMLSIWSVGIAVWMRREYDLPVPLGVLVPAIGAALLAMIYAAESGMKTAPGKKIMRILALLLLGPMLGIVFGGIYAWLVQKYTDTRSWRSAALLSLCLAITIFGFGLATHTELRHSLVVFLPVTGVVLAFRWIMGSAPVGFVNFGLLHFMALFGAMCVAASEDAQRKRQMGAPTEQRLQPSPGAAGK